MVFWFTYFRRDTKDQSHKPNTGGVESFLTGLLSNTKHANLRHYQTNGIPPGLKLGSGYGS